MAKANIKTHVCADCGQDFEGGPRAERCESCRPEYQRAKNRERTQAWRAARPKEELPDPVCEDCGKTFARAPNGRRTKKYCEPCRLDRVRTNERESMQRIRAAQGPLRRTCADCPADITGSASRVVRCEPCNKAHRTAVMKAYQKAYRAANRIPKEFFCKTCGVKIERKNRPGVVHYCDDCRPAAATATRKRAQANLRAKRGTEWVTHCAYCGVEYEKPKQGSRFPSRCFKCSRQRHYDYMRGRREANAGDSTCRDCGTEVTSKRKGPRHPRCASCAKKAQLANWLRYAEVYRHIRRAWKYAADYERFSPREIYERDGWRCGVCRKLISKKLRHPNPMSVSLDHKISLANGGPHSRLNTQPAHLRCNIRKNKYDALPGEQMPLPISF